LRIWDTEHNNGLLIYLLLADRAVETLPIVGFTRRWALGMERICRQMETDFKQANYEGGVVSGIQAVTSI